MIAVFAPDLMDGSRLSALAGRRTSPPFTLDDDITTLVVDLDRLPAEVELPGGVEIVGFGSHVHADAHLARLAPSGGRFVPRSRFFRDPAAAVADD